MKENINTLVMKDAIIKYLTRNIDSNHKWKVCGINSYIQVFIEAGIYINIPCFKNAIKNIIYTEMDIDVSCVHTDELGYCLLIEVCW